MTTPMLLKTVSSKKLNAAQLSTHRLALNDTIQAYATFQNTAAEKTLKVILINK